MAVKLTLPDLEERFLPPANWEIAHFVNPETTHEIYYRTAFIENAQATLFCLTGLSEYGEKYIEVARFFNAQGFNVIVIDWAYQGLSTRYYNNPHKRYSDGYEADISDLHYLITQHIKSDLPHYMLAHSMGGHIGLRFLSEYSNIFKAASFSTPMVGIKAFKLFPSLFYKISSALSRFHDSYIFGRNDWKPEDRNAKTKNIFSSDLIRNQVFNSWNVANENLRIGNVTYKWIYESLKSILLLNKKETLENINCPTLLSCASKEILVDNIAIKRASQIIPDAKFIDFENAKHEILMETDDIRDVFLNATLELFNQH